MKIAWLLAFIVAAPAMSAEPSVDCNAWFEAAKPLLEMGKTIPEMPLVTAIDWTDEALKIFDEAKALGCMNDPVAYTRERTSIVTLRLELKAELMRRIGDAGKEIAKETLHP